ncbi:MAG: hypothetical protein M0P39_08810 [Rhodocyclaceae bacterium]|jgi:hypothetical protein|nr:hypothetical protein [Rhodocyclaceae bacterium]
MDTLLFWDGVVPTRRILRGAFSATLAHAAGSARYHSCHIAPVANDPFR